MVLGLIRFLRLDKDMFFEDLLNLKGALCSKKAKDGRKFHQSKRGMRFRPTKIDQNHEGSSLS